MAKTKKKRPSKPATGKAGRPLKKTSQPKKTKKQSKKQRSAAAKKGWETRKQAAAEAERKKAARSAASKKGWETRRAKVVNVLLPTKKTDAIEGFTNPQEAADYFKKTFRYNFTRNGKAFYEREIEKFEARTKKIIAEAVEEKRRELKRKTSLELFDEMMHRFLPAEKEKYLRASDATLRRVLLAHEKTLQLQAGAILRTRRDMAERVIKDTKKASPWDTDFEMSHRMDKMTRLMASFGAAEVDVVPGLLAAAIGAGDYATRDALALEIKDETGWDLRYIYKLINSPGAEDFELAN